MDVAVIFVADAALPFNVAVIVPALKLPLPSRSTTVEAVLAVAYAIDDVTVVAEAAIGNWPVVMPEIAAVVLGHPVPSARQGFCGVPPTSFICVLLSSTAGNAAGRIWPVSSSITFDTY